MNNSTTTQLRNANALNELNGSQDSRSALKDDISKSQSIRKKCVVIVFSKPNITQFHFTSGDFARTANDRELWIEAKSEAELFTSIENFLIVNHEAVNVTSLTVIRTLNDICTDYEVIYNQTQA